MAFQRNGFVDSKSLQDVFIKVLRLELSETELDDSVKMQLTPEIIDSIYSLAKSHDLVSVVSAALYRSGLLNDAKLLSRIKRDEILTVYHLEQIKYAYEQVCSTFEEVSIQYIPLKGSVIRPYYPRESMRTSCDIDILIKEDDLQRAVEALTNKGFRYGEKNYHDVTMMSPLNVHLELHFSIKENMDALDKVLRNVWLYAAPLKGSRYVLSDEFLVFYQFAHMFYHFVSGGCGIRSLMDVWVMKSRMGLSYAKATNLLEEAGIYRFAAEMDNLADAGFGNALPNDIFDPLIAYILSGGTYGTRRNRLTVARSKVSSTMMYAMKRFFLPYRSMISIYPILHKRPFLLPFCYMERFFACFRVREAKCIADELTSLDNISDNSIDAMRRIWKRLGIE